MKSDVPCREQQRKMLTKSVVPCREQPLFPVGNNHCSLQGTTKKNSQKKVLFPIWNSSCSLYGTTKENRERKTIKQSTVLRKSNQIGKKFQVQVSKKINLHWTHDVKEFPSLARIYIVESSRICWQKDSIVSGLWQRSTRCPFALKGQPYSQLLLL